MMQIDNLRFNLFIDKSESPPISSERSPKGACYQALKMINLTVRGNPRASITAFGAIIMYSALSYYELMSINQIYEEWYDYRHIFSRFANQHQTKAFCEILPVTFSSGEGFSLKEEGELFNSLVRGKVALATYIFIAFTKPLTLEIAKKTLALSLRTGLVSKWMGSRNNQLGLNIVDNKIATQVREILYEHSKDVTYSLIGRLTAVLDIIVALGKIYDIYQIADDLRVQGLDFNLLHFMAGSIGAFLLVNILLGSVTKRYMKSALKHQFILKENIAFNMTHPLQVECSRATPYEFSLLKALMMNLTQAQIKESFLHITLATTNIACTFYVYFKTLEFAVPSIVKSPHLYFSLNQIEILFIPLAKNLWQLCDKMSASSTLSYAYGKINHFLSSLDAYQALIEENQKNFKVTTDPYASLSCDLSIAYPDKGERTPTKKLVNQFRKEFISGEIYAIHGPSGSGKSSFLNALIGINPYVTGKITITKQENIIYVPQKPVFKKQSSWKETLLYPLDQNYLSLSLEKSILEWVDKLQLEEVYYRASSSMDWINQLSGGEAQRLAVLQSFIKVYLYRARTNESIILLLDESINALDVNGQHTAFALIKSIVKKYHLIALHIDHADQETLNLRYGKDGIVAF